MIQYVDFITDLVLGDSGKGAVTYEYLKRFHYSHCLKTNGGPNAGNTIYIWNPEDLTEEPKKVVAHSIPVGVAKKIKSIIGPGCVVSPELFFKEKKELEEALGYSLDGLVFIAENAHIITKEHIEEDIRTDKIGSTKRGIGPAYTDKYARRGIRAKDVPELKPYLIDIYDEFYKKDQMCTILVQGSQGFYLDPDWGEYPYVTSSHCNIGGVLNNGISAFDIRSVVGVAKAYFTYVGTRNMHKEGEVWNKIQETGKEYGATTGRKRQCFPLDLNMLEKSVNMNGVTNLIIKKLDILEEVGHFELTLNGESKTFKNSQEFTSFVEKYMYESCPKLKAVIVWSRTPYGI